jgi:hypothetical protein
MLRIAAILVVTAAAFPAASPAARRPDTPLVSGGLVAKLVACDVTSATRTATFYARMDTNSGAAKLQIRFQLLERLGRGGGFNKVDLPALRQWHTSQASVKRFGWKQTVDALRLGGAYKVRVQYRWLSAAGAVLDAQTRDSQICRGPLPNLAIGNLTTGAGPTADTRTYKVEVRNNGKLAASAIPVSLSVDRAVLDTVTLVQLAPGETRVVTFTGPPCRNALRAKVDPDNTIGELTKTDNSQLFACS